MTVLWQLLLRGIPAQGPFKPIYDRQRRGREEVKEREAKAKRRRYRTKAGRARMLANNQSYKERFIERHGLEAWQTRQRKYKRRWRTKEQEQ